MVKILLKIKNNLLSEALSFYLKKEFNQNYQVLTQEEKAFNYDLIIFDAISLREFKPEDFSHSKKILIDTGLNEQELLFLFSYYKLSGIFTKDTKPELFPECIKGVLKGEKWLPQNLRQGLSDDYNSLTETEISPLTPKEREIMKLICEGLSNKEVAHRLSLSEQTVKGHLNRIFKKTGLKNRTQLVKIFYNTAIIPETPKGKNGFNLSLNYQAGVSFTSEKPRKILKIKSIKSKVNMEPTLF